LVIEWAKTAAGDRQALEFADEVAELLVEQTRGRGPHDWLFPEAHAEGAGRPRDWLRRATVRICGQASVPRVTPHGLRGTRASKLLRQLVEMTAWSVGHESGEVTRRHYLPASVLRQAEQMLRRRGSSSG